MGAGILAAVEGEGRRGDQTPHALVIGGVQGINRGLQPSVHLPGQATPEPEADNRLGDAHQPWQVPGLRSPVHRST